MKKKAEGKVDAAADKFIKEFLRVYLNAKSEKCQG